jgi:hypothetical protein
MSWTVKTKVQQFGGDEEIRTPDGLQILVGALEDQVLLYQRIFNNWGLKTLIEQAAWALKGKTAQPSWGLKTKIQQ